MTPPQVQQIEVGPMGNFAYIVACPKTQKCVLVDPAAEVDVLVGLIVKHDYSAVAIINTHGHADHIAGNAEAAEILQAPIIAHQDCEFNSAGMMTSQIFHMLGGGPSPQPTRRVGDDEIIEFGEQKIRAVHAPGHTPGDMLLVFEGGVITGDVLFVGALGRTDLPGSSTQTLARSLRERVATLDDDTVVYPGHNYGPQPTSTIGEEKRSNVFFRQAIGL